MLTYVLSSFPMNFLTGQLLLAHTETVADLEETQPRMFEKSGT